MAKKPVSNEVHLTVPTMNYPKFIEYSWDSSGVTFLDTWDGLGVGTIPITTDQKEEDEAMADVVVAIVKKHNHINVDQTINCLMDIMDWMKGKKKKAKRNLVVDTQAPFFSE